MNDKTKKSLCILTGCCFSLLFILAVFSPGNVDPTSLDWVIKGGGDNLQHYLGWRFYRDSGWNRYIFFMRNLNYPVGTSVIVTDSNPLFCLIFKLLNPILPEQFQFNGIWIIFSYLLLSFFSAKIGWHLTGKMSLTISGVLISVLNPVVLQRALIHDTLTAHWLILAAIWLSLNYKKRWNKPGWFILTELTLLIHIYFVPMVAFVLCLQMIYMAVKKEPIFKILAVFSVFLISLLLGYFIFGYSHILPQSGSYGELSMNLNAFINPDSIPSMLSPRPTMLLQYEGFNYWGLGLLCLFYTGMIIGNRRFIYWILPYITPVIILLMIAVSNHAYFDLKNIYNIALPESIESFLTIFRSSGRLAWPLYYLAIFVSISILSRFEKNIKIIEILVVLFVVLQFFDLKNFYVQTSERFRQPSNSMAELPDEIDKLVRENKITHLYCSKGDSKVVDSFALFAANHQLSFNQIASARNIEHVYGGDPVEMDDLQCGQIKSDSMYVYLSTKELPEMLNRCPDTLSILIDDMVIITKK